MTVQIPKGMTAEQALVAAFQSFADVCTQCGMMTGVFVMLDKQGRMSTAAFGPLQQDANNRGHVVFKEFFEWVLDRMSEAERKNTISEIKPSSIIKPN